MFIGEVKSANVSWCGETVLRDPPLSSVRVSRCWVSVLCSNAVAGRSHTALWKSNRIWVSDESSGLWTTPVCVTQRLLWLSSDEIQLWPASLRRLRAGVPPLFPGRRWWVLGTRVTISSCLWQCLHYFYDDDDPKISWLLKGKAEHQFTNKK